MLKLRRGNKLKQSLFDLFAQHKIMVELFRWNYAAFAAAVAWADLVHGNFPAFYLGLICRALRTPWVLTVHNWKKGKTGIGARLEDACHRGASRRWYDSTFVARTWQEQRPLPHCTMVPAVSAFPDVQTPPDQRKGFVFAARWIENKGLEELIEAYATSKLDRTEHPLLLIGDGPRRARAEELMREFGSEGITTPGFVSVNEKNASISRARWLVAPAKTLEDMGLTPIEARYCGVPSIVTEDGGLPEAAGPAGIVVEPGNVTQLREALHAAAAMSPEMYLERSLLAKSSLADYLKPLSFYDEQYQAVLLQK